MKMIVAVDEKNGIGKDNKLPWHLPADLKRFAKLTKGNGNNAVIMGRKTYESIGKPLPGRVNIVMTKGMVSQKTEIDTTKVYFCHTKDDVIQFCRNNNFDTIWVIGGSSIYKQFINHSVELYITEIHADFQCDTFFIPDYEKLFEKCSIQKNCINDGNFTYSYKLFT
jgi:dihydrofolate reductase